MRREQILVLISCSEYQISRHMRWVYVLLSFAVATLTSSAFAQDSLNIDKRANNFVYKGNKVVSQNFSEAESSYRQAISLAENKAQAPFNLGNAYYRSGYMSEALKRHAEAAIDATTPQERHLAFHNLGNVFMQQKECKKAVEAYKNALRNDPTDEETRYNLAMAQECAKEQGDGEGKDNKDKQNEDKEQQNKDQQKDQDSQDNKPDEKDGKDQEKDKKPDDSKGDQNRPQSSPSQLSKQQIKSLLEAMSNQEKKVQEKMNAKKEKGAVIKAGKDW